MFAHKMYSSKSENKYLLSFVHQTGVLCNTNSERVNAYPMNSRYLDEAYNMVNRMLPVTRRSVPRPTKAAQIGTLDLKNVYLKISRQI